MHTSLARRARHRRTGAARRPRGGGPARQAAIAIPLLLFSSFLVLGAIAFVGAVSAYAFYSRDLPDPKDLLSKLTFDQQTVVYDRTGTVELARLGERKRELVSFDELPPELIDATTAIEDKDFWSNPGFDFGGFISASIDTIQGHPRGGSTITQQLVRQRLLPEAAFAGSVYERKIREIIQSIRLTQEFPGDKGKQEIITAYLNQNFYGNQAYGVKAAAKAYFAKDLGDLTLAEMALLAAIPQSPTQFDLTKNAQLECTVEVAPDATCPADSSRLVVPANSPVVTRRNKILELMETRSVLSAADHTLQDYVDAMNEEVVLAPQGAQPWKAAQFVWQVRKELGSILCGPESAENCEKVDTGGYQVVTTLDWTMQESAEKWTYAAARVPNLPDPKGTLAAMGIPQSDWGWITKLRGENMNNAASAVIDYRTGQILAYVGSACYTCPGDARFQPQFDVLSDGWRQPGSAIKPVNYVTGIDDKTMTAATMFMDVVTNFGTADHPFTPTDQDKLERGPVRMRSALQASLNIPSIKASFVNGLDHLFARMKAFGLEMPSGAIPVASMGIGTIETHPIELLGAYGAIANGGVLMPRTLILEVRDGNGDVVYPTSSDVVKGTRLVSPQAAYIVTDVLAGNTLKNQSPLWAKWAILDGGQRRPAGYKTGTTSDNRDTAAYGFLAPPEDPLAPALAVGIWMGNSNNEPTKNTPSLESAAPLWSRILTEISAGLPMKDFVAPDGIVSAEVDAFSGLLPGPSTVTTVNELFIEGTVPTRVDDLHVELDIDQATGLLWQDGCAGPKVTKGFLDFSGVEPRFPQWQEFTQGWVERARIGSGVVGGPEKTKTAYFQNGGVYFYGKTWGGTFAPTGICAPVLHTCAPVEGSPPPSDKPGNGPPTPEPTPCITPAPPTPGPSESPSPSPSVVGLPLPVPLPTPKP
jgi:membrane peptidoglycan carboxypeptidase